MSRPTKVRTRLARISADRKEWIRNDVQPITTASAALNSRTLRSTNGKLREMPVPDRFTLVPEDTPSGSPRNVAQAYARLADAYNAGSGFDPDFDLAVTRHRLLDAFERSANEGRTIQLAGTPVA